MAAKTYNDILNSLNNFVGDASVGGTTEATRKMMLINTAKDYLISMIGLPASEVAQEISFIDNQNIYAVDDGMLEPISLRYNEAQGQGSNNKRQNANRDFEYLRTDELYALQQRQANDIVYWGMDYGQNDNDIVIITNNIIPSQQINSFDQLTSLYALGDASNLALDTNVYKEGNASTSFSINYATGKAYIQYQLDGPTDFTPYLNTGVFNFDLYIQGSTGLNGVSLQMGSDAVSSVSPSPTFSNYWKMTTTNGSLAWNTISLDWADAVMTGSPDVTKINYFQIEFDIDNTFVNSTLWRLDDLKLYAPDSVLFTYYTGNVVQDGTTAAMKSDFENSNDIASFASIDPSIIRTVAALAAQMYKPTSLSQDSSFIKEIADQGVANLTYRFPKKVLPYMGRFRTIRR